MPRREMSTADVGDHHRRLMALAALSLALMYATSSVTYLVEASVGRYLDVAVIVFVVLTFVPLVPIVVWKARQPPSQEWHLYKGEDGFIADALSRAHIVSWATTLLLLTVFTGIADRWDLPTEFWIRVALAVMLAVFAIVFLLLSRTGTGDELEVDSGA